MFETIEEGLAVYREKIKDFLIKSRKIDKRERKSRQNQSCDYRGCIDWPPDDYNWEKKTQAELAAMSDVLGLSTVEVVKIWQEIEEELPAPVNKKQ